MADDANGNRNYHLEVDLAAAVRMVSVVWFRAIQLKWVRNLTCWEELI